MPGVLGNHSIIAAFTQIVSTLVIEEARVSGWYTCVAQNEEGNSTMRNPFFIKGKLHYQVAHVKNNLNTHNM